MAAPTEKNSDLKSEQVTVVTAKNHGLVKLAGMQIVAGGSAGLVEVSLMHPLDLVKTRFQVQRGPDDPQRYKSLADCFRRIYAKEGIASFYKGILPPILAETPKRATKFFTFEQYKKFWAFGEPAPNALGLSMAGLCSGLTEAIVINPFEVVKVRLQAERDVILGEQKSAFAIAREVVKKDGYGMQGLNKGLTATLGRHGVWNMIYFGFYHNIKDAFPQYENPKAEFGRKFAIGLVAGTLASTVNIPFDVAKSRIQGPQPVPGVIKYRTCFRTMVTVFKEEGAIALFKGWVPKIMRLGPGGAIMLMVYEQVYEFLKEKF
ncbi:PREDICTED: mitochondrial 2-oxodicarboxylate carrier-like [Priapulus caudatus]|uniref:Mitochondrial 2-oxodicarboxylate carrier n=1 Tax=Priapulus caudatus TaxID=37621 RepID=A0ABM1DY39_PRICU|nr:PREDICTED: mitochondrial 2-oxodicarboxylate carrier-like [Priapulus caudatus]